MLESMCRMTWLSMWSLPLTSITWHKFTGNSLQGLIMVYIAMNSVHTGGVLYSQWENYFKWQLVHKYLPFLGTTHLQAIQAFRQTTEGVSADSSRVFTCVRALQTVVPFTLARLYTKFILPNGTREQMSEMVTAIKTAFIEELKNNTWLDQQTIDASIDKVMHTCTSALNGMCWILVGLCA